MLDQKAILIVEDNSVVALDLALAVEELGGEVIGPAESVDDALVLIEKYKVAGAVLDCQLIDRDVTPVVMQLIERGVPLVIQTGTGLASTPGRSLSQFASSDQTGEGGGSFGIAG